MSDDFLLILFPKPVSGKGPYFLPGRVDGPEFGNDGVVYDGVFPWVLFEEFKSLGLLNDVPFYSLSR